MTDTDLLGPGSGDEPAPEPDDREARAEGERRWPFSMRAPAFAAGAAWQRERDRRHPEPVKPTEALRSAIWDTQDGYSDTLRHEQTERVLSAVLALWPGRSAAEVKAEALREVLEALDSPGLDAYATNAVGAWIAERADRIERGES